MNTSYTMDEYFETRERDLNINEALSSLGGKKNVYGPNRKTLTRWLEELDEDDAWSSPWVAIAGNVTMVDDPGREEKVIRMRFGMDPYSRSHTQKEVAEELDVGKARAREIELKALRKLRHYGDKLKVFLND